MKKAISVLICVLLLLSFFPQSAFAEDAAVLDSVTLSASQNVVRAGDSLQLTAQALDSDNAPCSEASYTYTSTNEYIAAINSSGLLTAKHAGNVIIVATAQKGSKLVSATLKLLVTAASSVVTFDQMTVGELPTGFTGSACAVEQQTDGRAAVIQAGGYLGYSLSSVRLTVDTGVALVGKDSITIQLETDKGAVSPFSLELEAGEHSLHLEADLNAGLAFASVDGVYKGSFPIVKTTDTVFTAVDIHAPAVSALTVDDFDCRSGIHPLAATFEGTPVGSAPDGATNVSLAAISGDNAYLSLRSLCVNDTSKTAAGSARFAGTTSQTQTFDFDLFIQSAASGGGVSLKILNGGISNANTGFWIKFYNGAIQAYTGAAWVTVGSGIPVQKWFSVHIEADAKGTADVYINGSLAASCAHTTGSYGTNALSALNSFLFFTAGNGGVGDMYYVDNFSIRPYLCHAETITANAVTDVSSRVNIALNSEPVLQEDGSAYDVSYIREDYTDGYGWAQIPFLFIDSSYQKAYIDYSRHRDTIMDDPIDSVKVYNTSVLTSAFTSGTTDLCGSYSYMKTDHDMFLMAMTEISTGRYKGCYFAQNYIPYYTGKNTASTASWIVDPGTGTWTKVQGTLTLDTEDFNITSPNAGTHWFQCVFSKGITILDDGTILQTMYGLNKAILVQSTDWGKTWTQRSIIAENTSGDKNIDGSTLMFYEPSLQRCADGSLLSVIRTGSNLPLYQARSYDNGLTWTPYETLPGIGTSVVGSIYPQSVLLDNGILVLTTGRPNNSILLSLDGSGYEWGYTTSTMLPASGESTTGNTSIAKISGNSVLIVGDRGFVQDREAGIWAVKADISRNLSSASVINNAYLKAQGSLLKLSSTTQAKLGSVIDTNGNAISLKNCTLAYYSLNPEIASVSADGAIKGLKPGQAQILAAVTYKGVTVNTPAVTITVADPDVVTDCSVNVSKWVLDPGSRSVISVTTVNAFGASLAADITYTSENPDILTVTADGIVTGVRPGVAAVDITADYHGQTFTKSTNIIVQSSTWYIDSYDELNAGAALPETHSHRSGTDMDRGVITSDISYSGTNSLYIRDDTSTKAIQIQRDFAPCKGAVIEFMLNIEKLDHLVSIAVGDGDTDSGETCWCGFAAPTQDGGPIRLHAYNGSWINVSTDVGAYINEWFQVRIEVTVDKPARLYVNGKLISELFMVGGPEEFLTRLRFTTGGTGSVNDYYYVDDLKIMTFNDDDAPLLSSLSFAGVSVSGFNPNIFTYHVTASSLFVWRSLDAVASDPNSTITVTGDHYNKTATVTNGHHMAIYKVSFDYYKTEQPEDPGSICFRSDANTTHYIDGYPDGTFGVSREVTRAELAMMLYRLSDVSRVKLKHLTFTDVPADSWAADAIDAMTSYEILTGHDGLFEPDKPATRAEVARALAMLSGLGAKGSSSFTDCSGHTYDGYLAAAQEAGIIDGYPDGTFRPDSSIIRAEVVTMINRAVGIQSVDGASSFTDVRPDFWAVGYINAASMI